MLVRMPHRPEGQQNHQGGDAQTGFEAGLRRDLASAPVVACGSMLGGWPKRAVELVLTLASAPVWAPVLGVALLIAKRRSSPALAAHDYVGYGGQAFTCRTLNIASVSEDGTPANDTAPHRAARWRRIVERLPLLFSVIRGDMALVGPSPLTAEQLDALRSGRRYYLSARPGVMGISAVADGQEGPGDHYKIYALSWSFMMDALIVWDAFAPGAARKELESQIEE